jgi:hypothetical protein
VAAVAAGSAIYGIRYLYLKATATRALGAFETGPSIQARES